MLKKCITNCLACPTCLNDLVKNQSTLFCKGCNEIYPRFQGVPVLYHSRLLPFFSNGFIEIEEKEFSDPFMLYYKIWTLKNNLIREKVENIIPSDVNPWKQKQYKRVQDFVSIEGTVLDVGCGFPEYSKKRIGVPKHYFGLDSFFSGRSDDYALFSAEYFPIKDAFFDNVTILGVLDHIIDYKKTIDEAYRVLKPGGFMFLSSLVWAASYELVKDHFSFSPF